MDERTQNIATTCFASGCATFLALYIAAPTLGIGWALAIAAGIGAPIGYFGYRFKDVLRAIPRAARATWAAAPRIIISIGRGARMTVHEITTFFGAIRPVFIASIIMTAIIAVAFIELRVVSGPSNWFPWTCAGTVFFVLMIATMPQNKVFGFLTAIGGGAVVLIILFPIKRAGASIGIPTVDAIGACFLLPFLWLMHFVIAIPTLDSTYCGRQLAKRFPGGDIHDNMNRLINPFGVYPFRIFLAMYGSAIAWCIRRTLYGIAWIVGALSVVLFWYLLLAAAIAARIFRIIHSDKRTICAVDGPLGGIITYAVLRIHHGNELAALPTLTLFGLVLLGGAVAALIGIVNFEIISILVLKTLPARVRNT